MALNFFSDLIYESNTEVKIEALCSYLTRQAKNIGGARKQDKEQEWK